MRRSRRTSSASAGAAEPARAPRAIPLESAGRWFAIALILYLALQFGDVLFAPFLQEDYLLLTHTHGASLAELLRPNSLVAHYYRPWSREIHYALFQGLFGANAAVFRLANFALAWITIVLFFRLVSRLAGPRAALVAGSGLVLQAAWATTIIWIAGVQDLWMLAAGLGYLLASVHRRQSLAALLLVIALLSKETAAVLPAIATMLLLVVEQRTVREVASSTLVPWIVLFVWAALHPMLGGAWFHGARVALSALPISPASAAMQGVLSLANLDRLPAPGEALAGLIPVALPGALVLGGLAFMLLPASRSSRAISQQRLEASARESRAIRAGLCWAVLGGLPLLQPGVGWQPYYGLLAACGAWLAIGTWLGRHRRTAIATIVALALTRSARAHAREATMGSEWHQRRLAAITRHWHDELLRLHPAFPPHARVFFGDVPWGLGLVASHPDSPALRVWYGDTTMTGGFYSAWRPRAPGQPPGRDFIFLFEGENLLAEVVMGPEDASPDRILSPRWASDHDYLARRLFDSGDPRAAEVEWRKLLAVSPGQPEWNRELAVCMAAIARLDSAAEVPAVRTPRR